ncbi:unnamed protein product, partial [Prorocentrum cordatum]
GALRALARGWHRGPARGARALPARAHSRRSAPTRGPALPPSARGGRPSGHRARAAGSQAYEASACSDARRMVTQISVDRCSRVDVWQGGHRRREQLQGLHGLGRVATARGGPRRPALLRGGEG